MEIEKLIKLTPCVRGDNERERNKMRYVNHSDKPNAEFDGFDLYSTRPIKPDEEITINYEPF